jgi:acrylyl-CoA reductase (NADPH)
MTIDSFKALRVHFSKDSYEARIENLTQDDLNEGDTLIEVHYSSINYKDALAVTGKGKILKNSPLTPGIDSAGVVVESKNPSIKIGEHVAITGCNQGEVYNGGYSQYTRFDSKHIIPLEKSLSLKEAMIFGTAGFTAALCIDRMEDNGQTPDMGPIVVTGATGGVGSFAVSMLAGLGYEVIAVSGKKDKVDYLKELGASKVSSLEELSLDSGPLCKARFGGAIDNIGGDALASLMAHTNLWGNIACVGLAASHKLDATVMPMILRGVSLLGISSNNTPDQRRRKIWQRLATDLKPKNLDLIHSHTISLEEVKKYSEKVLNRQTSGRILVDLKS